jgi:hypothetical protein
MTKDGGIGADEAGSPLAAASGKRLPCRGCRNDCMYFESCDGRPWRMVVREAIHRSDRADMVPQNSWREVSSV